MKRLVTLIAILLCISCNKPVDSRVNKLSSVNRYDCELNMNLAGINDGQFIYFYRFDYNGVLVNHREKYYSTNPSTNLWLGNSPYDIRQVSEAVFNDSPTVIDIKELTPYELKATKLNISYFRAHNKTSLLIMPILSSDKNKLLGVMLVAFNERNKEDRVRLDILINSDMTRLYEERCINNVRQYN